MTITIDATYENAVLKPLQPLPLKEHETVRLSVHTERSPLLEAYGIMGSKARRSNWSDLRLVLSSTRSAFSRASTMADE
jgi:predicted DNA-binding antitoxin AbrB/MazE fold protein